MHVITVLSRGYPVPQKSLRLSTLLLTRPNGLATLAVLKPSYSSCKKKSPVFRKVNEAVVTTSLFLQMFPEALREGRLALCSCPVWRTTCSCLCECGRVYVGVPVVLEIKPKIFTLSYTPNTFLNFVFIDRFSC